jgi:cytochrome c-type biogenesis protein CcmH
MSHQLKSRYSELNGIRLAIILALLFFLLLVLLLSLSPASAQGGGSGTKVSDDDVNNVARKLYCPVCENIPLDTCGTAACAQWREEIRVQLSSGRSEQQVINDFVNRFGDRVVGTPQDPTLRALSLITPWIISAIALVIAVATFVRWRMSQARGEPEPALSSAPSEGAPQSASNKSLEEYRLRLERDLAQRR